MLPKDRHSLPVLRDVPAMQVSVSVDLPTKATNLGTTSATGCPH